MLIAFPEIGLWVFRHGVRKQKRVSCQFEPNRASLRHSTRRLGITILVRGQRLLYPPRVPRALLAWVGRTDLRAANGDPDAGVGPIAQVLEVRSYDAVVLLSNFAPNENKQYAAWLKGRGAPSISLRATALSSPTSFKGIYPAAVSAVEDTLKQLGADSDLTYHLSPGTSAMAAVWAILAKTRFPGELVQSSKEQGVETASLPFEMSPDFIPDLLRKPDEELRRLMDGLPDEAPEFDQIVHRDVRMKRLVAKARRVAPRSDVAVLILGETGTGKELLARAIHQASPRKGPFKAVNCAAIPDSLFESELFGTKRGGYTGATHDRAGCLRAAAGGTLFLDEVGELSSDNQAKLLRAIQEREVQPVGDDKTYAVDVRLICATNRDLQERMANGNFRSDLYYRIAGAVLWIPPIRERQGDLELLIDHTLGEINQKAAGQPGYEQKTPSAAARSLLRRHTWPGNVRELQNVLLQASVWCPGGTITPDDIRAGMAVSVPEADKNVIGRPLGNGLDVRELIATVARHYLERALKEAGSKTKAATLVGLPNYQTFTNWMEKYGVRR